MPPAHPPPSLPSAPAAEDPTGFLLFFYPILFSLLFPLFFFSFLSIPLPPLPFCLAREPRVRSRSGASRAPPLAAPSLGQSPPG